MNKNIIILIGLFFSIVLLNAEPVNMLKENDIINMPQTQQNFNQENNTETQINNETVKNNKILQKQAQIKKLKEELRILQNKKRLISELKKFNKKIKLIIFNKKNEWKNVYIPLQQIVTFNTDIPIERMEFLPNKNLKIIFNQKNPNTFQIIAYNQTDEVIKIFFANGLVDYLHVFVGGNAEERYISYKILASDSLSKYEKILKKINVKNVYEYFKNTGIKLIVDFITRSYDENSVYPILLKNRYVVDKYLFKGYGSFKTIYGIKHIPYEVILKNVYESPYIGKIGNKIYRLILLDIEIKNNSKNITLAVTDTMIQKRFTNFVVAYIGNVSKNENLITPLSSKRILVVVRTPVKR